MSELEMRMIQMLLCGLAAGILLGLFVGIVEQKRRCP